MGDEKFIDDGVGMDLVFTDMPGRLPRERAEIDRYWADGPDGHEFINAGLRTGDMTDIRDRVGILDDAVARRRTTGPATLYRAVAADALVDVKVGDRVRDKAFLSATSSRAVARRDTEPLSADQPAGRVLRLDLPAGVPMARVPSGLDEYLLPRSMGLRVTAITDDEIILGI